MCKELEEELEMGGKAAHDLVKHVGRMRASEAKIPIKIDLGDGTKASWEIVVRHLGVHPK